MLRITFFFVLISTFSSAQTFERTELPTALSIPWEITYGPDDYLWLSESDGKIIRVEPETGDMINVFQATDFFAGDPSENLSTCFNPPILGGTLGLALHPDFLNPDSSYLYLYYSYNAGTITEPKTWFKIVRVKWNSDSQSVSTPEDIVANIPSSYDHVGGRLLAIKQNGQNFLFLTIELNAPDCYPDQNQNPNNFAGDITTMNGKIHRFNMDGTIPENNPIPGNSMYTRGHRNPQGLIYNPYLEILYDVEHGDRTDDEINILIPGMNYGWKNVRGYHDGNFPGELDYISNYSPNPEIANDRLIEPLYSWCITPPDSSSYLSWCTVAPSDGIYYSSPNIPQWTNSLLVVTLKDGDQVDKEVYQFKLDGNGKLVESTVDNPNPKKFFGEDQNLNGRLRDIAVSPDGKKIYLINNFGTATNKITVYTVKEESLPVVEDCIRIFPNPAQEYFSIQSDKMIKEKVQVKIFNLLGELVYSELLYPDFIQVSHIESGTYFVHVELPDGVCVKKVTIL